MASPVATAAYILTDTTGWGTAIGDEGQRAVLRRGGWVIDTVDLDFGVKSVGQDSIVYLPVRTDSIPLPIDESPPAYESAPTEHILWTPSWRRELREWLPYFDGTFSSPAIPTGSTLYYWGIAPSPRTFKLYAVRYDFRSDRLDSLYIRDDRMATDYRYYLPMPNVGHNEVRFGDIGIDPSTWTIVRHPPSN